MADTAGLLKSRGAWTDAVADGLTNLPHKVWYEQMMKSEQAARDAIDAKAGFDSVNQKQKGYKS